MPLVAEAVPTNGVRFLNVDAEGDAPPPICEETTSLRSDVTYESSADRLRDVPPRRTRTAVNEAIDLITAAHDPETNPVEASNLFDEWKRSLEELAERAVERTGAFRQVLGMLVAAVRKRDVTDFQNDLPALATLTSILGRASVNEADAREAFSSLRRFADLRVALPTEPASDPDELDARIDAILADGER